jgi:hypothetical protein
MLPLKLGFTDTFGAIEEFFTDILSKRYTITRDDANPDYLIFGDRNFGNNNVNYDPKRVTKIFYTGENARPWDYSCHFSISFDHHELDGKNYRLPLYVIYDWDSNRRNPPVRNSKSVRMANELTIFNKEFCSFVVKNPNCEMRNTWFQILNSYRPVSSGGPLFNNIGGVLPGGDQAVYTKQAFLNKHKFNLCFENASYPGYATEKLYEALCAKTVPIYWGSPTIELDFNPKAFLNRHNYNTDKEFLSAIIELDKDHNKYLDIYFQPMFAGPNKFMDTDRLLAWFAEKVYRG